MNMIELIDIVKQAGVAGAGGAGFPTYAKIDSRTETIILNCAECEPLLKVHRQLLTTYAYEILQTLSMMGEIVGAKEIFVGIKESYKQAVNAIKGNVESFPSIQIKLLPEIYPAGDEVVLIYETTKKVVPAGKIPIQVGATVFNVETVLNIYNAVNNNKPVIDKYITIAGEVNKPITVKAPIGITVDELLKSADGVTVKDPVYIMGGPMTGSIVNGYDLVTKTTNAILVFDSNHQLIRKKTHNVSIDMKRAMSVCCQCNMCTDLCPRNQLGHPIAPHAFMRAATSGTTKDLAPFLDTMFCCSCGLCELYACGQDLSPRTLITEYKNKLRSKGVPMPEAKLAPVDEKRQYRRVPVERLASRLGLDKYQIDAPLKEDEIPCSIVKIKLSQHIGAPAKAIVNQKDKVVRGQLIAEAVSDKLSIPVHASISGEIIEVNQSYIIIKA